MTDLLELPSGAAIEAANTDDESLLFLKTTMNSKSQCDKVAVAKQPSYGCHTWIMSG